MNRIKETVKKNTMLLALAVVMILFEVLIKGAGKGSLFDPTNITNIINQNAYVVILACGMLLCILTGGNIDLSVGSIVALVGAIAGKLIITYHMNIYLAMIICLLCGLLLGAWQGLWIAYVRIPAFIVTLTGMLTFRGLANLVLNGQTLAPFPEKYTILFNDYIPSNAEKSAIMLVTMCVAAVICVIIGLLTVKSVLNKKKNGQSLQDSTGLIVRNVLCIILILIVFSLLGKNKGIPVILILLAVIVFVYNYFTSNTIPGRRFYAMGGNEKAAQLSGINTNRILFGAYVNMGFLSALAALVCVARFNSAAPSAGTNYEMDAIAACYIGGASAYGGTGTVMGAVIGAAFMGVLNNGMSILGVDSNWQRVVKGLVLLAAVIFDVVSKRKSRTA